MTLPEHPDALHGIWPALLTPLTAALDIDLPRFAAHARALIDAGCAGVTPFGTTGEGPAFSVAERISAVDALVAGGVPASKIVVSAICTALPDTIALARHAVAIGARACLILPPFYMKGVPDAGIVDAYAQVIDRVDDARLRVILYHIPQVAGVGVSIEVIETLRRRYPQQIVGLKDSGCAIEASRAYAQAFMPPLQVWVGNELDLPALGRLGSRGAISGLANFMPRLVERLVNAPDAPGTPADLARTQALLATLGGYALIPALKGVMALRSGDADWLRVRPPLRALDDAGLATLRTQWAAAAIDPVND